MGSGQIPKESLPFGLLRDEDRLPKTIPSDRSRYLANADGDGLLLAV